MNRVRVDPIHKKNEDFRFLLLKLLEEIPINIDAAGIAGNQQLGSFVAAQVNKIKTLINQQAAKGPNVFSDSKFTEFPIPIGQNRLSIRAERRKRVKGMEAITKTKQKNHHGSK